MDKNKFISIVSGSKEVELNVFTADSRKISAKLPLRHHFCKTITSGDLHIVVVRANIPKDEYTKLISNGKYVENVNNSGVHIYYKVNSVAFTNGEEKDTFISTGNHILYLNTGLDLQSVDFIFIVKEDQVSFVSSVADQISYLATWNIINQIGH